MILLVLLLCLCFLGVLCLVLSLNERARQAIAPYSAPPLLVILITILSALAGFLVGIPVSQAAVCEGWLCGVSVLINMAIGGAIVGFVLGIITVIAYRQSLTKYFTTKRAPWTNLAIVIFVIFVCLAWYAFGIEGTSFGTVLHSKI